MRKLGAEKARDIALWAGREAAAIVLEGWEHVGRVRQKASSRDLVTEWDTAVEERIVARLIERAPGVPIVGEEGGLRGNGGATERWLIDPIDGTMNFVHGLPVFAVSIAYEYKGRAEAGAVIAPALNWEFVAARGRGATMNGISMAVSQTRELSQALLATGFPVDRAESEQNNFATFVHLQRRSGAVRRFGAAALDLCFVARGWLEGYWEFKLQPWDLAAGVLMVEEAGGKVTRMDGSVFESDLGEVVASNQKIHDEFLQCLSASHQGAP